MLKPIQNNIFAVVVALISSACGSCSSLLIDPVVTGSSEASPKLSGAPIKSGDSLYFTGNNGTIFSLDAASGTENWRFETGQTYGVNSGTLDSSDMIDGMALDGGLLYVPKRYGGVSVIDAETGEESTHYNQLINNLFFFTASSGLMIAATETGFHVFEAVSGTEKWSLGEGSFSKPAVSGASVYTIDGVFNELYALDLTTGAKKWKYSSGIPPVQNPTYGTGATGIGNDANGQPGENVDSNYASQYLSGLWPRPDIEDGYVIADIESLRFIDADTGLEDKAKSMRAGSLSIPVVKNEAVYGITNYTLKAVDLSTGEEKWSYSYQTDPSFTNCWRSGSQDILAVEVAIYYTARKCIAAHDAGTGALKWKFDIDGLTSLPVVDSGVIYIPSTSILYALDADSGAEIWRFDFPPQAQ